jgi:hypothetical protein
VISLRYHLVAIVGIFLALAVGLLAGSAFVEPELVDQLREQTDNLRGELRDREDRLSDVEAQLEEVRAQIVAVDRFAEAAFPHLAADRLLGTSVIVVSQDGVEDSVLGQVQRSLVEGGAQIVAVVSARNQLASDDPDTHARLAELLGLAETTTEELPAVAATAIAERLVNGNGGLEPQDDLLAQLLSAGFLAPVGAGLSESALQEIGAIGQVVVVLGGGEDPEPILAPEGFAVPLVRELSRLGVPVAAGESTTTAVPFVEMVRDGAGDGLVTVDDLDLSMGGAALVLGLDELLTTGRGGAYGVKDGAEPLPPPS